MSCDLVAFLTIVGLIVAYLAMWIRNHRDR